MRYKLLGTTGVRISELCLGSMTFGEDWNFGASQPVSKAIFDSFCRAGGNFVDTANTYTYGTSEKFVGEFINSERDYFVVSTKYSLTTQPGNPNGGGNNRKNMARAVEQSLRRLNTEFIDIYWLHAWDSVTAVDEIMRGLQDLVSSGKVLYIGISNAPAWVISQANTIAGFQGWSKFVGLQTEYSLIERTSERDLLPMAKALGLSVLAWGPLAGGVLSGKYVLKGNEIHMNDTKRGEWLNRERLTARSMEICKTVRNVADEVGCEPSQVALSWMLQRGVIPIIGSRTLGQFEENLGCLKNELEMSHLRILDAASEYDRGFPHEFLSRPPLRQALFGEKESLFEAM